MSRMSAVFAFAATWVVVLFPAGCTIDHGACGGPVVTDPQVRELAELYELAAAPRSHAVRAPTRLQRERALHLLAERAATIAAEWDSELRPTALTGQQGPEVERRIENLRQALRGLESAARRSDMRALHDHFAGTIAAYRSLSGARAPVN